MLAPPVVDIGIELGRFKLIDLLQGLLQRIAVVYGEVGAARLLRNGAELLLVKRHIRVLNRRPSKEILAQNSIQTLFTKDVTQFRGALQADWCIHAYRLAVLEGLRPGELLGLRWEDLNGSTLTIHQSINDLGEVTDGKNENANRTIVLTGLAVQEIEAQRKQLHDRGMVCKWIFPNEKCQPFRQKAFRNRWYKYCETNQISAVTPYELRHTFVSICDEMPDGLKKQVVGHSRNMDTNGIYGHRKTGDLERAAAYSDAAFRAIL